MALPSSGALSLNAMHVEAGGSSGTSASINDSDIRGLISKGSGAQMSFNEWYGASSELWSTTVTVGSGAVFGLTAYGYTRYVYTVGSISDNTVDFLSGATLLSLYYQYPSIAFTVSGLFTNTGFTSMDIDGNTYNRTDASHSNPTGQTNWQWNIGFGTNPFGTVDGASKVVTFS